jgi:DNA polymerase IIIc chi subunit
MNSNFLKKLIEQLRDSERFILISSGSGKSNAAEVLMSHLEQENSSVALNLIEIIKADVGNLSDNELLALGRERWEKFQATGS